MKIERFEEIIAWQKSKAFAVDIYSTFKEIRDFGFRDQIQRASVSIMNNIAEGFERRSDKELKQGLYVAKGSCAEVRSMLHLATDLNYASPEILMELREKSEEICRLLSGFIKSLS